MVNGSPTQLSPLAYPSTDKLEQDALSQMQTPQEKGRLQWMTQAKRLNPNVNMQTIGHIYDEKIGGTLERQPSIQDQLSELDKFYKKTSPRHPTYTKETDPDKLKSGYDGSDKVSILGSLLTTGKMGVEEGLARMKQLSLQLGQDIGMPKMLPWWEKEGAPKNFIEHFRREESKNKLFQEAMHQHPTIGAIGRFAGSTLPLMTIPHEGIENAIEQAGARVGASKFVTNALRRLTTGGAVGALQYDPEEAHSTEQAVTGALTNLALPYGGKMIKGLGRPFVDAIKEIAQKHNISLPVYPVLEKLAHYVPFSGISNAIGKRGEQIEETGKELAASIMEGAKGDDYGAQLHGEVKRNYKNNQRKIENLFNRVGKLADEKGGNIQFRNLREVADRELEKEANIPEDIQNKRLITNILRFGSTKDMSYSEANEIKKRLGDIVNLNERRYRFGSVSGDEKRGIKKLYGAFLQDMQDYADRSGGNIKELHNKANKIFIHKVLPFLRGKYAKFLSKDYDTDDFIGAFLKPDRTVKATRLLELLPDGSEKGKIAARAAILHHALDVADIHKAGFNAEKFINEAMRLGKVNKILFTKEQNKAFEGYRTLINYTKKLSPASLNERGMKGLKLTHILHGGLLTGSLLHPHLLLPIILSANVFSRVVTSDAGRKILMKIASLGEKAKATQITPLIRKLLSTVAISGITQETTGI